jgi:mono/diheme cytochrome c family protein
MFSSVIHYAKWPIAISAALLVLSACSEQAEDMAPAAKPSQEYNLSLGIVEFMNQVVDPTADELWATAGWVNSADGYYELYPTTDEEWNRVRQHAAMIVEIGNMLALPGRAVEDERWQVYAQGISSAGIMAMNAAAEQNEEDYFQAGARLYSVCSACHQAFNPDIASPVE